MLDDLSRWYVKLVRDRVKDGDPAALWTLQNCLYNVTLAVAPITPHITEQVYQDLFAEQESVHMERFPDEDIDWIDDQLEEDMAVIRELVETASSLRQEENINLRWPLKKLVLSVTADVEGAVERLKHIVKDRANVKQIEFGDVETRFIAKPNYAEIGPRFGEDADEVANYIEEMNQDQIDQLHDMGEIWLDDYQIREDDVQLQKTAVGTVTGRNFMGGELFLDTKMTEDLEEEAFIRELIRNIQEERKEAGLDVQDTISLHLTGHASLIEEWRTEILDQVNAEVLKTGRVDGDHTGSAQFEEYRAKFGFSTAT